MTQHIERVLRDIGVSRRLGGAGSDLSPSKIHGVGLSLARSLPENYPYSQLETELAALIVAYPSVREHASGSQEQHAADAATRSENPTIKDLKSLRPDELLAHANAKKMAEIESAGARDAKLANPDYDLAALRHLSVQQRLSLANERKAMGVEEPQAPKPVTREQLARMTAERRLSVVNQQALEASRAKKAKP